MALFKNKILWVTIASLVVIGGGFLVYKSYELNIAHSTLENYSAFRGCTELLEKTDSSAVCKLPDGTTITLVKINNKWYLEGDGPGVW